jgi:hypothetical protein
MLNSPETLASAAAQAAATAPADAAETLADLIERNAALTRLAA